MKREMKGKKKDVEFCEFKKDKIKGKKKKQKRWAKKKKKMEKY